MSTRASALVCLRWLVAATLWLHIATDAGAWSLTDETFESFDRNGAHMGGRIRGNLRVNATRHPELGRGTIPVTLDLGFLGDSAGFRSETNRREPTAMG